MSAHHVARRLERRGVGRTWPVGGRVFLAYPDEVGEGVIVERGMGDYVRKRGPLTIYMGSSSENRRDPFWYEHPGGRTYKETPQEVVEKVLPHVGFERLDKAKVYPS